jgi:hypothetical protein
LFSSATIASCIATSKMAGQVPGIFTPWTIRMPASCGEASPRRSATPASS